MAISHAQPLLLLIVSFFLLPALGDTTRFKNCDTGHQYPVEVKTVKISPDPVKRSGNANVTITGYTSIDIPDGATVTLDLSLRMIPVSRKHYSLCDITACPVLPSPLLLTLSNIFTVKEIQFLKKYDVTVSITDKRLEDPKVMCVVFGCRIRGYASLLSTLTE